MGLKTAAGTGFFIGPKFTGTLDEFTTAGREAAITALAALTYTEVGEVEDAGTQSDDATVTSFTPLKSRRVKKFKGALDAGTQQIVIGADISDAGQGAMQTAYLDQSGEDYAFKLVYPDGEVDYYIGKVSAWGKQVSQIDNVLRHAASIARSSGTFTDAA